MPRKIKLNLWSLLPILLDAVRTASDEIEIATSSTSPGAETITPAEAERAALAISRSIGVRVLAHLTRTDRD